MAHYTTVERRPLNIAIKYSTCDEILYFCYIIALQMNVYRVLFRWEISRQLLEIWRCGSVVRTSVFGWQAFPDLRLICGWYMTTSWVNCPLWSVYQANSAFHLFWVGKRVVIQVITWITGVENIKLQTVWLFRRKTKSYGLIGFTPALSVTQQRHCSCSYRL